MAGAGRRPGRGRPLHATYLSRAPRGATVSAGTTTLKLAWSGVAATRTIGTSWNGNDDVAWQLGLQWSCLAQVEPVEDPPVAAGALLRESVTMPTPTYVNGQPDGTWLPTFAQSTWAKNLQLVIGGVDRSRPRGQQFIPLNDAHTEPFGDAEAAFAFPGITEFDDPATFGLVPLATVALRRKDAGNVFHTLYEGEIASLEPDTGQGVVIQCTGTLYRLDLLKQPPALLITEADYGVIIAQTFNNKRFRYNLNVGHMATVTTGIAGTRNASFSEFLTGAVQDYLAEMTTDTGSQWTVKCVNRTPVLTLKDTTTVHATISYGAPGVDVQLSKDFTTATTAVYGSGTNGHCFPADTRVLSFGDVERGYRRAYSGAMVKVTTASGAELSGTPNHPVMTGRGWVALGEIKEGDYLVSDPRCQDAITDSPDVQDVPTAIGEVFKALSQAGLRERAAAVDMPFHGDWSNGEVEVVSANGELLDRLQTEAPEERLQRLLIDSGDREKILADLRLQLEEIFAPRLAAEGTVGRSSLRLPLLDSHGAEMQPGSLQAPPRGDIEALQPVPNAEGGHAEGPRETRDRFATEVAANEIVVIDVNPDWTGHVYNLQTSSGVYSANGFLVANCSWMGARFPNLTERAAPAFPLAVGHTFVAGDGQTGFADFAAFLRRGQYGTIVSDDTYDPADVDNVQQFQSRAGITVDGIVGAQTWEAAFQPGFNQGSIKGAYVDSIYEKTETRKRLYNAQGADVGPNPAFDPSVPRVEEYVPFGDNVSKQLGRKSAKQIISRNYPAGRVGTIVLAVCPQEMCRYDLAAGMNVRVQNYAGSSVLVHVTRRERDWKAGTVTLTVDEKARDQLTAASIHQRNKDVSDLTRRQKFGRTRAKVFNDYGAWLCEDGAGEIPLMNQQGGFWNTQRIAAAPKGTIERISLAFGTGLTEHLLNENFSSNPPATIPGAARGCFLITTQPITPNQIANLPGLATPLTNMADGTNPWDHNEDVLTNTFGKVVASGGPGAAVGFFPNNDPGDGSSTNLTGRHEEGGSLDFGPTGHYWLWVSIFSPVSCLVGGRVYPGAPN